MKLTKMQAKAHQEACQLLTKPRLSDEERWFVLEHWHAGARHINTVAGAHFTPVGLARDLAIEVPHGSLIDLCAGIGALAFCATRSTGPERRVVCVEINPDYVEVGRKILPHATWICCDVFQLRDIGHFRCALANPPFGSTPRTGKSPRNRDRRFEYHLIDLASDLADYGVFLIPQDSCPFRYSGQPHFETIDSRHCREFRHSTGIELEHSCGIDTSPFQNEWHDVSPATEVVIADFAEARSNRLSIPETHPETQTQFTLGLV